MSIFPRSGARGLERFPSQAARVVLCTSAPGTMAPCTVVPCRSTLHLPQDSTLHVPIALSLCYVHLPSYYLVFQSSCSEHRWFTMAELAQCFGTIFKSINFSLAVNWRLRKIHGVYVVGQNEHYLFFSYFFIQQDLDYPEQLGPKVFRIPNFPVNQRIAHFNQKSIPRVL